MLVTVFRSFVFGFRSLYSHNLMDVNGKQRAELVIKMTAIPRHVPKAIFRLAKEMQFAISYKNNERILESTRCVPRKVGTEVCIQNLPSLVYEDRILHHFMFWSNHICKVRLMIASDGIRNAGTAVITFASLTEAKSALMLDNTEIIPGYKINVKLFLHGNLIYISGIPVNVNREEVLGELKRVGFYNISDIILLPSYGNFNRNRGYVFVEFFSNEYAEFALRHFQGCFLFGRPVRISGAKRDDDVPESVMSNVKALFIKNLKKNERGKKLINLLRRIVVHYPNEIEKVFRRKDYAFVHFKTRKIAEAALIKLQEYYYRSQYPAIVQWAKPAN